MSNFNDPVKQLENMLNLLVRTKIEASVSLLLAVCVDDVLLFLVA